MDSAIAWSVGAESSSPSAVVAVTEHTAPRCSHASLHEFPVAPRRQSTWFHAALTAPFAS